MRAAAPRLSQLVVFTHPKEQLLLADLDYVVREEVDDGFSGCSSRLALRVQNVKRVLILFV